jgi:hypothetical protein
MTDDPTPFLDALFSGASSGLLEVRTISSQTHPRQEWFEVTETARAASRALALRKHGNVDFGVQLRQHRDGGAEAINGGAVVWADIDSRRAFAELLAFPLSPSSIVASGTDGHYHAYWLLGETILGDEIKALNLRLAHRLGADDKSTDVARILRVPGTLNHKTDPPTPVKLEELNETRYTRPQLDDALARGGQPESTRQTRSARHRQADGASPTVANVLERLKGVRGGDGKWQALCPAHDDTDPSLSICEGAGGRCLLKCHADCELDDVINELGLGRGDLFPDSAHRGSYRDRLLAAVEHEEVELFHDSGNQPYAKLRTADYRETLTLRSGKFASRLHHIFYRHHGQACPSEAVREAVAQLAAQAQFDGPERQVHRRVGGDLDRMWIDLGSADRSCVEIRNDGTWALLEQAPIEFVRGESMQALPLPRRDGSVEHLRPLLHLADDDRWTLFRGALLAAYHPTGPYFVSFLHGTAGSGKTSAARYLAALVDPFEAQFLTGTAPDRDALLVASKCRLVGIDNMSRLTRAWSDTLCAISTGGGDRRRMLYTDDDLISVRAKGPSLVTALVLLPTRGDLIDRLVPIGFERISDQDRRAETDLNARFVDVAPLVMGGLFDLVANALRHVGDTKLDILPRMADVTQFVTAAERGDEVQPGTFANALGRAQADALSDTVETSPFLDAVVRLMDQRATWRGPAMRLMEEAAELLEHGARTPGWPATPSSASVLLDEYKLPLSAHGIELQRGRAPGGNRERFLTLYNRHLGTDGTGGTADAST